MNHVASEILAPQPGTEPGPVVGSESADHWGTRELPFLSFKTPIKRPLISEAFFDSCIRNYFLLEF